MHGELKPHKSGIVTLGWHVKYYLFIYNNGVVNGVYTSSEMPAGFSNFEYREDFNIKFKYFGINVFNSYVWLTKDGQPNVVYVTEYEMKRREADRDENLAKHRAERENAG
jgi:hypothetical protein